MTCFNPKFAVITRHEQYDDKGNYIESKNLVRFIKKTELDDPYISQNKKITCIPCGKCIGCQLDKANDWAVRCLLEMKNWKYNYFITLTYDDEHIHIKNGRTNLIKKDLQDFLKRLRYYFEGHEEREYKEKIEKPIRYFCSGEYGTKTERSHFHIGIFNLKIEDLKRIKTIKKRTGEEYNIYDSKKIKDIWGKGFIMIEEMTYETACYIARYIEKKAFGKHKNYWINRDLNPEFTETSRRGGIGINGITNKAEFEKIKENYGVYRKTRKGVKLLRIPSYIRNKWKEIDEQEYYIYKDKNNAIKQKYIEELQKQTTLTPAQQRRIKLDTILKKMKSIPRRQI